MEADAVAHEMEEHSYIKIDLAFNPWHWDPILHYSKLILKRCKLFPQFKDALFPSYFTGFQMRKGNTMWFLASKSYCHPTTCPVLLKKTFQPHGRRIEGIYNPINNCKVLKWQERGMQTGVTRKASMGRSELQKGLRMNLSLRNRLWIVCLLILPGLYPFNLPFMIGSWFPLEKDFSLALRMSKAPRREK